MKDTTHKARKKRAQVMYKFAQQIEEATQGLQTERNKAIFTRTERGLLLRCEELGLKTANIIRRVAVRMEAEPS